MKCDLTAHLKVHNQDRSRRYQCHVCGKTFFQRYYLPRHMLQHQGIKNFRCEHCGDLFTTNYGLRKHCWRKHGQPRPSHKQSLMLDIKERNTISVIFERKTFPSPQQPPSSIHKPTKTVVGCPLVRQSIDNISYQEESDGDLARQDPYQLQKALETSSCSTNSSILTCQGHQNMSTLSQGANVPDLCGSVFQGPLSAHSTHRLSLSTSPGPLSPEFVVSRSLHTVLSPHQSTSRPGTSTTPTHFSERSFKPHPEDCLQNTPTLGLASLLSQAQVDLQLTHYTHHDLGLQHTQQTAVLNVSPQGPTFAPLTAFENQQLGADDMFCNIDESQRPCSTQSTTLLSTGQEPHQQAYYPTTGEVGTPMSATGHRLLPPDAKDNEQVAAPETESTLLSNVNEDTVP
ncbi:zinc finger protein 668 [Elysia marginata]|uniref:Zinc finger protein 668 n=1 Tax=Elysia marginata TaxID=1093978 RepID=A0AAV4HSR5_9GAST|nr:zinc finger protein 668 [Elysia marginata]